jgi:predicted nuclease with TOPRIM domain
MSVVGDVRQGLQDFLAPELSELKARLNAIEKELQELKEQTSKRLDSIDQRFGGLQAHLDRRFDRLEDAFAVRERVLLLEQELHQLKQQRQ